MCELCRRRICPGACPNTEEFVLIGVCVACGGGIYLGDEYYKIAGDDYCEDCICDMRIYTYT